ncbi:uncharacterized protein LOC110943363 [Helianthus annuus]|uniref:uncharacterized protein LOC110943363 n=1 Tax=Helianthus annuus TaxID=4232 RepID=UPI000B8F076F|nr:uncharacterized protein LOC110943363 [Helianthus annuus]
MEQQGEITFLNDINALSTNFNIKVKIISLWRKKMKGNERETYRIDMILMDEMGTKIQASCLHRLFSKFERHLNVDECLIIKRPSLAANTASFKIVPNNQKLSFYYQTFVEKCSKWDGPQFVFDFVDFKDVVSQRYKENFIGYVVVCYKIEDTNKKDGTKGKRLNLKLQDLEDVEIDLTLWDDYAKDMCSYMLSQDREAHVVIAVHFGAVKTYKGKWGISNNFDGTRLFINDNFDQILTFKEKFIAKLSASSESSSHVGSYVLCSVEDEFMKNDVFSPIAYLGSIIQAKKVVIVGTIVAIVSDKMWYYDGCNYCKSKVEQKFETYDKEDGTSDVRDEKVYQCSNKDCQGKDVFPMSRLKIPIRVQDSTGTVTLTMFDHEVLKFVGKTAKELIQIQDDILNTNEVPRAYPVEFETLVNIKCAFVIRVTNFNITNAVENYGISVLTNDADILDQLNKKWKIDQLDASDSFSMGHSEFQDDVGKSAKDGVSYTGDNSTPVSKDFASDFNKSSTDLKRNLGDVYVSEDVVGSSKMDNRFKHQYSSSSEPSMNAVINDYYTRWLSYVIKAHEARHRPKLRKLYLDNKRSKFFLISYFIALTILVIAIAEAKRRRRLRKLYLDSKRSKFNRKCIPSKVDSTSSSATQPNSEIANLLNEAKLIIWDEAPMVHKHAFEALDRTLKDVLSVSDSRNSELPFGGKTIVFSGDFRQILPVVQNGTRQDIVHASLCLSYIWSTCKVLKLTRNMRLSIGTGSLNIDEINDFAKWLLEIGEGNLGDGNDGDSTIEIPNDLLITDSIDPIQSLIDFVYPSVLDRFKDRDYFSERAILAPKNEVVHGINDRLLALFPGEEVEYLSSDSLCPTEEINDPLHQDLYNPDVLNSVIVSGLPNHRLITRLGKRVIEAEILSGGNVGSRTYIPRISMIPSDKKIPFKFQRRQFPITVCFAMTINKSQGQSLSRVGLYLRDPVFSHGQLYVALSRVKTRDGVKLLIFDKDGRPTNTTTNVVYKEIFGKL